MVIATTDAAGIPIPTPFDRNGEPLAQLDKRLRDQIGYRILHLALRSVPVPQDVWFHSFKQLQNYYKQQSRWKDLANMYFTAAVGACRVAGTCLAGQLMGCDCARADGATPADYDPAPDGVASACHPAEPVSCGRYDGAVTKFGGWKGKRFAVV